MLSFVARILPVAKTVARIPGTQYNFSHIGRYITFSTMAAVKVRSHCDDIQKSQQDKRSYRGLELTNGMKMMLISDPETDKSSAAMDVHIGHMSDPVDLPGLAHFCEHMLFLGTEKYPEENAYSKFLNEHGGSSNAFTSAEHTNYYFDVQPEHLGGALDRFAQFFLCPLFTASATEREVNAVNSENDKNLQSDGWRLFQLEKSTANPNHAYSRFGTGNKFTLETRPKELGLDTRDELLKFHSTYYSANLMSVSVLGKESLDELEQMALGLFADVENKNVAKPEWQEHPYGMEEVKMRAYVVPVKELRSLSVTWPIPDLHPYYTSNPGHYLGHLIGHEGAGSLLSELKARGWVNTLVGGQKAGANGFMFFMVNVDLTEEGIENVDEIVTLIFQYLNMLKKEGPQEWVFKECQDLYAMQFRFKDKEKPRNYTCQTAALLHEYPISEALSAAYLLREYKPDLITMLLDKLVPDTIRIAVIGKKFEGQTDMTEKWYGTEYKLEKIPTDLLEPHSLVEYIKEQEDKFEQSCVQIVKLNSRLDQLQERYNRAHRAERRTFRYSLRIQISAVEGVRNMYVEYAHLKADELLDMQHRILGTESRDRWNSAGLHENLRLPEPNEFIPTNFDLYPREEEATGLPRVIRDSPLTRLWFKQDDKFLLPKCCIDIEFTSPMAYSDPLHTNMTYMFIQLFRDALNEYAYEAELAGLTYSLDSTIYGMFLMLKGYNDKQHILLAKILEKMTSFQIDEKRYNIILEAYERGLRNFKAEQPHQHAIYYTTVLTCEQMWTKDELYSALDDMTLEKLQAFIPQLLAKLHMELLVYGNTTKQKAEDVVDILESTLQKSVNTKPTLASQRKMYREVQLPDGCNYVYRKTNDVHKSSSLEVYYQCFVQETHTNMLLELFCQLISEPCFDILRTQEQLGYIVFSGVRRANGVQGLRVIVQSDKDPQFVENRIEAFLMKMKSHIEDMSEDVFSKHVGALAAKRMEQPKRLGVQNARYWNEITSQQYNFDRDNIEVTHLKSLKKEDVLDFYKDLIAHDAPRRHKMCVHVSSSVNNETVDSDQKVENVDGLTPTPCQTQPIEVTDITDFKRCLGLFPLPKPFINLSAKSKL